LLNKLKSLQNHQGFMKYFSNSVWLLLEKILRIVVGLFIGVWIIRYLGPDQFGTLSYIGSFVGIFGSIASLGVDVILVRELVKTHDRRDELLGTAFGIKLLGATISIILLVIGTTFTSNDQYTNFLILIISPLIIFNSFNVVDLYFQSIVKNKYIVYVNVVSLFISSIIKILLLLNEAPLEFFVYMVLFDSIVVAIGYLILYKKLNFSVLLWRFRLNTFKILLKDSWPLIFSGVVISLYMRIDQIMIKEMLDFHAVGQYAAAVRLSEAWYFIPVILGNTLVPAIIKAKSTSESLYYKRLQNFYTFMVWIAIFAAVSITFLSEFIINILYGSSYNEAIAVLVIHVWAGVFLSLGIACGKWYLAENYTIGALKKAILGLSFNLLGNYILIPMYGIQGAAISTLFGHLAANLIYDIFDNRVRGQLKYKIRAFFPVYLLRSYYAK